MVARVHLDDRKIGQIPADEGLVTEEQLEKACRCQKAAKGYKPLGQILVDQGVLTPKQLNFLLDRHLKRALPGEFAIKSGRIDEKVRKSSYAGTAFMRNEAVKLLREENTDLEGQIRTLPYANTYDCRALSPAEEDAV